jgi:hypothetical protein
LTLVLLVVKNIKNIKKLKKVKKLRESIKEDTHIAHLLLEKNQKVHLIIEEKIKQKNTYKFIKFIKIILIFIFI